MANDTITATTPTSTATTAVTEPDVVAGILSGEPREVVPEPPHPWHLIAGLGVLAAGLALGYGVSMMVRHKT
jgi:hypothetical protein